MTKIYLPTEYVNKSCKVVYDGYIRVYDNTNYNSWNDVYYKYDYYVRQGSSNYSQTNVVCVNINVYTDDVFYRYDFSSILIMLFIMLIICLYFPYKVVSRILGKWGSF